MSIISQLNWGKNKSDGKTFCCGDKLDHKVQLMF